MSYTILYGIKEKKKSRNLADFQNSHGFGTVIWDVYFKEYLGLDSSKMRRIPEEEDYNKLWKLSKDNRLPQHHKTILMATYDYSIITKPFFKNFANDLSLWQKDFGEDLFERKRVNHVPDILDFMIQNDKVIKKFDSLGIQITDMVDSQYNVGWGKKRMTGVNPDKLWNIYDHV